MMIASTAGGELSASRMEDALARVPERAFGETDWVRLALQSCATYLEPAIASGKPYRIANALRAIAHKPTAEQIDDIVDAACDSIIAEAYAERNVRAVADVAQTQKIITSVLTELQEESERRALEPALLRETVTSFVRMTELSDKRLGQRLKAVGDLAARIATAMHLPRSIVTNTEFTGLLHDVGMMSVSKDRGHKTHALLGESFVRATPMIAHLAPFVRAHHERYDGSGFPDGLRGEEIPIESRIVSVAAAFVELVTETSRHKMLSPIDACHEIAAHSGAKFDPDVITAALHFLQFNRRAARTA